MNPDLPPQVDLAIIGGGINGAGLAALAAHSGLSVALLEKDDFASGTSSKSTKLIHGGIRYLELANFALVFEALHERSHLLRLAPHLVRPLAFLLPVYQGDKRPAWMLKMGLWLYDLLAGIHNIRRHQWFSAPETLAFAPNLRAEGLKGCGLYYDAQVNDARLVLENILSAEQAGAWCLNYHEVLAVKNEGGDQAELLLRDRSTGESRRLKASCLVNAAGPWANRVHSLLAPQGKPLVRPTRGSHLVVDQVLPDKALLITTRGDNRVIFVIPWRGYSLVGTTDLDDEGDPDKTAPTEEEIRYLLGEASRLFPGQSWDRAKVLAAFSGLRPLAWTEKGSASSVSREDRFLIEGKCVTIVGGKLTTYRAMARKALKACARILNRPLKPLPFSLPGAPQTPWEDFEKASLAQWPERYGIHPEQAAHLARLYGQKAQSVLELTLADPALKEKLDESRPEILAQVVYAVREEKAVHLGDVMLRRLEIGYTPARLGSAPEKASRLLAQLLHWDEPRRQKELADYQTFLFPRP
ncbi:MAG TPA: glycerol-3-phosphate dehydrogenase [bacterium]|nr:glycerol-3-phosphate dehydrogenase [bacterium]